MGKLIIITGKGRPVPSTSSFKPTNDALILDIRYRAGSILLMIPLDVKRIDMKISATLTVIDFAVRVAIHILS